MKSHRMSTKPYIKHFHCQNQVQLMDQFDHIEEVNQLTVHFRIQWQESMEFDHYKSHSDSLDIRVEVEQDSMYLRIGDEYMQYATVFDRSVELQSKREVLRL